MKIVLLTVFLHGAAGRIPDYIRTHRGGYPPQGGYPDREYLVRWKPDVIAFELWVKRKDLDKDVPGLELVQRYWSSMMASLTRESGLWSSGWNSC